MDRTPLDCRTERLVAVAAIAFPILHSVTDVLEWAQNGFSPVQLWLNYIAFLPVPAILLGLYAAQRPRISRWGLFGAVLYGFAFVYFTHTTLYALATQAATYEDLWTVLGRTYTVHGAVMVLGGAAFGLATFRAGVLPRWTAALFLSGIALNLILSLLPVPDLLQTLGTGLRNAGLVGMGWFVGTDRRWVEPSTGGARLRRANMIESVKRFLWLTGTLDRARYLALGVSLFGLKFALDGTVAHLYGRPWSLLSYLVWPDRESVLVFQLAEADRQFGLTLLALALPFIWIGVTLTTKRLRDADLPLALVLLFFVPVVNVLILLGLCLVPSRPSTPSADSDVGLSSELFRQVAGDNRLASFWLASLLSAAVTVGWVYLSATVLRSYGFGVFVAAPFALGLMAAMIHGLPRRRSKKECQSVALTALAVAGAAALALAFEGLICIAMAAPIALVLVVLGGRVGYVVQSRRWAGETAPTLMMGLLVVMPSLMTAESLVGWKPAIREVRTEVLVKAPAERVWGYVVAFPPLAEPSDLLFRAGVAYPLRAEIQGRGVGAVRHCVFSTGAFVEPIEAWDPPRLLAFRVTDQPPPMNELSPFDIHPPHLDRFLESRRGQFRLERLADGRTRLEGTTWYANRMWPAVYWGAWSDAIIHRIHRRVLVHVRDLAEADEVRRSPAPAGGRASLAFRSRPRERR